jgi:hypothetical protein
LNKKARANGKKSPHTPARNFVWQFSSNIYHENISEMQKFLVLSDAFKEPEEGKLKWL